jgi:gamma-glutamyltranspeptidase / glutathione hydrolase
VSFTGRRSPVFGRHAMVASTQPLANEAGLQILRAGGNAADAAVAMAAALNVLEPTSTGIGGDAFGLFYDVRTREVKAMNGSGRSSHLLTLDLARAAAGADGALDPRHPLNVTVPGAAAAWRDTVTAWGSGALSLEQVLAPAVTLATEGAPIGPVTAAMWKRAEASLQRAGASGLLVMDDPLHPSGRAPRVGEVWRNPTLAETFRALGRGEFYEGAIADAIVERVRAAGGVMDASDLTGHVTEFPEPCCTEYAGKVRVWECPPNGQGIAALLALNILEAALAARGTSLAECSHVERLHLQMNAMRLAFEDARALIADPYVEEVPVERLLSKEYAAECAKTISGPCSGAPEHSSDTVSFQVVDGEGNAVAFINSNYMGFGSFLEPRGCGFTLQNRGANFSLDAAHPNRAGPSKRPYHTIIPCMGTVVSDDEESGRLAFTASVMGGFMQPQGHLQVVCNLVDRGMDPQSALDAPRFCIGSGESHGAASLEEGVCSPEERAELERLGHSLAPGGFMSGEGRELFGRGQIIFRDAHGTLWGGSDPRGDGCATGW